MEAQLVSQFVSRTGADPNDALSCLNTWGWDLKRALTDYNDTSTNEYFNGKLDDHQISMESSAFCQNPSQIHKPNLNKSESVDIVDYKKLARGISRATDNVNLVSRARSEIAMDFHTNYLKNLENLQFIDTPDYTFTLPDLSVYPDEFRKFLEKDLIECSTLNALEQARRLNWWTDSLACRKLWPLSTTGDGNCLLHAASLAMWGFHDRKLTLRAALYGILSTGDCRDALWRRWRFQQTRLNKQAGFVYSESEWAKEWEEIVAMASPEPRQTSKNNPRRRSFVLERVHDSIDDNATYESLEEIHVLALAHVLKRTIIVIADTVLRDMNGEAMAPIPFGGIYMPFEIPPIECHRSPLLLTYDMAHFSALVTMETASDYPSALIPLTDCENVLLPIHFCIDPGKDFNWCNYDGSTDNWTLTDREHIALLREYMDIVNVTNSNSPEDEIYEDWTDDEYDKRINEIEITLSDDNEKNDKYDVVNNKSKAAKQLQSVAKQFGSIGKSMSKKIKKNIGSITKIGNKNNQNSLAKKPLTPGTSANSITKSKILCAQLKAKRHEYQEEMVKNYLECAHERFMESTRSKERRDNEKQHIDASFKESQTVALNDCVVNCINGGCINYGTASTSYMCPECYEKQKQRESTCSFMETTPRYGTGNSKFYTQTDLESHNLIKRLPSVRRLNELDQTLYLSNSTFYNDKLASQNVTVPVQPSHGYNPAYVVLPKKSPTPSRNIIASNHHHHHPHHHHHNHSSFDESIVGGSCEDDIDEIDEHDMKYRPSSAKLTSSQLPPGVASVFSPGNSLVPRNGMSINLPAVSTITSTAITEYPLREESILLRNRRNMTSSDLKSPTYSSNSNSFDSFDGRPLDKTIRIATPFLQLQAEPCRTKNCVFYGSANTNFYCSKCCQNNLQQHTKILSDV